MPDHRLAAMVDRAAAEFDEQWAKTRQYVEYLVGVRGAVAADALAGPTVTKLATLDVLAPEEAGRLLEDLPGTLGEGQDGQRAAAWRADVDAALRAISRLAA